MAQGRGNAKAIVCMLALLAFSHAVDARNILVGGSTQNWDFPPGTNTDYYATWAAGETFAVGDILEFKYQAGAHDVQAVTAAEYDGCLGNSNNPKLTSGFDTIPLPKVGDYHFICTLPSHCDQGMKLKVTVVAAAPPATPPVAPPTTPPVAPPTTPPVAPPTTPPVAPPTTPPVAPPTTPPAAPPVSPPVRAPVAPPTIAPTPVPVVEPPTSVPEASPPVSQPEGPTVSTGGPTATPPAPGSAHSVRVGFGVVGAAVVAAIGALLS